MLGAMDERGCSIGLGQLLVAGAFILEVLMFLMWKATPQRDDYTFATLAPFVLVPIIPIGLGLLLIRYGRRKDDV